MPSTNDETRGNTIAHAAMVASEVFIPGASELIVGEIGAGVGTFVATGVAVAVLAPAMPLLATLAAIGLRVNSYMVATKRSNLLRAMSDSVSRARARRTPAIRSRRPPSNRLPDQAGAKRDLATRGSCRRVLQPILIEHDHARLAARGSLLARLIVPERSRSPWRVSPSASTSMPYGGPA